MKCVIATGGSGGHIFPALETAKALRLAKHEVIFAGTFRHFRSRIEQEGFLCYEFATRSLAIKSLRGGFDFGISMIRSLQESLALLKKFQPDVVVGFGGYGAFPVVMAGIWARRPTIIHEQNVVPGRANRFLAAGVKRIAVSWEESQAYLPARKVVLTGCPCRLPNLQIHRVDILKEFGFIPERVTILVLGGSQGSLRINREFAEASVLLNRDLPLQVIHLSGERDESMLKEHYAKQKISAKVFSFFHEMEKAYAAADVVIARAGAMTLTEIAIWELPAILIPYPYAGGHQQKNAEAFLRRHAAVMIRERGFSTEKLLLAVRKMLVKKNTQVPLAPEPRHSVAVQRLVREIECLK